MKNIVEYEYIYVTQYTQSVQNLSTSSLIDEFLFSAYLCTVCWNEISATVYLRFFRNDLINDAWNCIGNNSDW